ncbi:MAG TPA: calcium-binding protein [Solirubrobacteraceae bacterium]|jgi:hypothetical protein
MAVALGAALAGPAAANAAEIYMYGGYGPGGQSAVYYYAQSGEVNSPTFGQTEAGVTISDPTADMRASYGNCVVSADKHTATCSDPRGVASVGADLGDGDDTALVNYTPPPQGDSYCCTPPIRITGGGGDDRLTGSDTGNDDLSGNAGDDVLDGRGGDDHLSDSYYYGYPYGDYNSGGTNVMRGGPGDDSLTGGTGADDLQGEAGKDRLDDGGGTATMIGGPGDDTLSRFMVIGQPLLGRAIIDGGLDLDTIVYNYADPSDRDGPHPNDPGATIRLDAGAATDGNGFAGMDDRLVGLEDVTGSSGRDLITGSAGQNNLFGMLGNDVIAAGPGRDNIEGGADADTLDARDGEGDRVRCSDTSGGDPGDKAAVDDVDLVDRCPVEGAGTSTASTARPPQGTTPQVVEVPVRVTTPADTKAPDITGTKLAEKVSRKSLLRRGYKVDVRSKDAQPNQVVATLTGRLKGRARIAAIGDLVVAQRTRTFTGRTTFRLKVKGGKLRKAIRRRSRLRLLVEVRDATGNLSTRSVRVRVR